MQIDSTTWFNDDANFFDQTLLPGRQSIGMRPFPSSVQLRILDDVDPLGLPISLSLTPSPNKFEAK